MADSQTAERPTAIPRAPDPIDLEGIPVWLVAPSDLPTIAMREAFLLIHVDGVSTVRTIIEMSRLPHEDALSTLASLVSQAVIDVRAKALTTEVPPSEIRSREQRWSFSVQGEPATRVRRAT
jgi:hypothetical protein